jgi:hypothetical protein
MNKILGILIACLITSVSSKACGNLYYFEDIDLPLKNGFLDYEKVFRTDKSFYGDREDNMYLSYYFLTYPIATKNSRIIEPQFRKLLDSLKTLSNYKATYITRKEYLSLYNKSKQVQVDFKLLSDYAWMLAKRGEFSTAKLILEDLYKKYPNEYNINANLGTVYELLGNNVKALSFIQKAIAIDKHSHHGSEWIHENILLKKNNKLDDSKDLLNMYNLHSKFEENRTGALSSKSIDSLVKYREIFSTPYSADELSPLHRDTLMIHLAYQLHERMMFIGGKDEIMAALMLTFTDLMMHRKDYTYVGHALELVNDYSTSAYEIFERVKYIVNLK